MTSGIAATRSRTRRRISRHPSPWRTESRLRLEVRRWLRDAPIDREPGPLPGFVRALPRMQFRATTPNPVIPANAGIQCGRDECEVCDWTPAFAGATERAAARDGHADHAHPTDADHAHPSGAHCDVCNAGRPDQTPSFQRTLESSPAATGAKSATGPQLSLG